MCESIDLPDDPIAEIFPLPLALSLITFIKLKLEDGDSVVQGIENGNT